MAKYSYVGTKNKKMVKGEIEAQSELDAKAKLREANIQPTQVFLPLEYASIQFISYQVNTFPKSGALTYSGRRNHTFDGKTYKLPTYKVDEAYLGKVDSAEDIDNRCYLVKEAIEAAAARAEISADDNCLKLFMMPEFYFRGGKGAYSLDDYQKVIEKLRKLVEDDKWNHWLFVFGTVLAIFEPLAIEAEGSKGKIQNRKAILNTALVQKGGAGEEKSCVIIKDVMSDIDFSRQKSIEFDVASGQHYVIKKKAAPDNLWDENVDHLKAGKQKGWWIFKKWDANQKAGKENQVANYSGLGIFEMEKITFGLEVCLDHALQRLKKSPPPKGDNWIQVQLIPSAGMDPMTESIVACKHGWVFNCDGNAVTKVYEVKSEWQGKINATLQLEEIPMARMKIHKAGDGLKKFNESFTGEAFLKIFQPKPLPAARAVT
jgi:hypothetical protein